MCASYVCSHALCIDRSYTTRVLGLRHDESTMLLEYLFSQAKIPELQLRVRWEPGSLVVWDNEENIIIPKRYYAFKHFSTLSGKGFIRVSHTHFESDLYVTTFLNSNENQLVVLEGLTKASSMPDCESCCPDS